MQNAIEIYVSGVANNQNKIGGYGILIIYPNGTITESCNGNCNTTNNRMDLRAAIEALKAIQPNTPFILYSRSQYLISGINEWLENWLAKGNIPTNSDLWIELIQLMNKFHSKSFVQINKNNGSINTVIANNLARTGASSDELTSDICR